MEIDVLFWLAIIAVYLFQYLVGKKKRAQSQQASASEVEGAPTQTSQLDDALSEISRMLTGEPPALSTPPWPSDVVPSVSQPDLALRQELIKPESPADSGFFDDSFEKRTLPTFRAPVIVHDHDIDYSAFDKQDRRKESKYASLVRDDLHDLTKTREAFVLLEVLGPPRSKQRIRPRR